MSSTPDTPKKKKKLPFKRTVARKSSEDAANNPGAPGAKEPNEDDNGLDFFRRSKDVFPMALEEVAHELKEGKGGKGRRESSSDQHARKRLKLSPDSERAPSMKRERTPESSSETSSKVKMPPPRDDSDDDLIMDVKGKGKEVIRAAKTPTPRKMVSAASPSFLHDDGDDYSDDWNPSGKNPNTRQMKGSYGPSRDSSPAEILDGDDEDTFISKHESDTELDIETKDAEPDEFSAWIAKAKELEEKNQDVVITVFVNSRLEGTVPLGASRKLGQGMRVILDTWIAIQRNNAKLYISEEQAEGLFMTWKGNKVYDHTTIASLGVEVDANGDLKGGEGDGVFRGGLALEVWTEESHAEYIKEKELKRAQMLGFDDNDDSLDYAVKEEEAPPAPKPKGIRVVLKAKDSDPFKISIRNDTTVTDLLQVFRDNHEIDSSLELALYFDGERLEDESAVADADLDPDDTNQLEVHVI
ncbi:ubiquitin-2 like Rad60 SUMO-like-domain-containing protein [Lasiosphaeria hispida]|uniref:Ubiquitin-2 like Rad60 SUMO-like-domain-containing protein n=1 Tax=Lasiosphaeria hispida TaxID=260671 RepID=A0AAJ0HHM4_9PEZI|nr:ubiquitin-2 like Rad60 SUMO-like-domain-containing protein [Lasiosphaeria hispida]